MNALCPFCYKFHSSEKDLEHLLREMILKINRLEDSIQELKN
jgi:hypothetical protein